MSEAQPQDPAETASPVSVRDVRAIAGASTPHFALQVRDRIRALIAPLAPDDPARIEGERQIAYLEELAEFSGDPRSGTGIEH